MTRMTENYRSIAFAAAAALMFAATPAKADALPVQGIVAEVCTITTTDAGAGTLDLSTTQANTTIATVAESCNSPDGYTVSIATTNGTGTGLLVSQDLNGANSTDLTYTIRYDSIAKTFVTGNIANAATRSGFTAPKPTVPLDISYTIPGGGLPADTYTDTLTLTLTAS